jgi:hypothetical protein
MKFKLPIFLSLSIIFSLSLLPSFSYAQSIECPVGALFNIITGQPCAQSSTSVVPIVNTSSTCLTFTKNLSFGQRSADIIKLQQFLKTQGDLAQSVVVSTNFGQQHLKLYKNFSSERALFRVREQLDMAMLVQILELRSKHFLVSIQSVPLEIVIIMVF